MRAFCNTRSDIHKEKTTIYCALTVAIYITLNESLTSNIYLAKYVYNMFSSKITRLNNSLISRLD